MAPECVHRARGSGACECRVCIACSSLYLVLLIIRSCIIVIIVVVADSSAHSSCTAIALPPYTFCNSFFSYANAQTNKVIFYSIFSREIFFLKPAASECKFQTSKTTQTPTLTCPEWNSPPMPPHPPNRNTTAGGR